MLARKRPLRRAGALAVALTMFGAVPAVLVAVSRWRLGSGSPLAGMDPPWAWSRAGMRRWWGSVTGGLDTSDHLVDLFVRAGLVVAWACVAVLAVVVISEVAYQVRHGMPSGHGRSLLGVGRLGRWIAAGLLAVVPLGTAKIVAAGGRAMPTVPIVQPRLGPVMQGTTAPVPVPQDGPVVHVVRRGESVWSIAEQYAPPGEVDAVAAAITSLNLGRVMNDGHQFVTAALIEPGWELRLPSGLAATPVRTTPPHAATPPIVVTATPADTTPADTTPPLLASVDGASTSHVVEHGESYWSIAEDHLDAAAGHAVSERAIFEYVPTLMSLNVDRLGYDDPAMLHPGDTVLFADQPAAPQIAVAPAPPVDGGSAERDGTPPVVTPATAPDTHPSARPTPPSTPPTTPTSASPATAPAPSPATTPPATTPPATTPPATTPPTPDTLAPYVTPDASSEPSLLPIGLGGAGLVAAGAVAVIESRRRARLRAAQVGERLTTPISEPLAQAEQRLRTASDAERIARLDLALRAAAADLANQQAQVRAALVSAAGEVTLLLDVIATPISRFWRVDAARKGWVAPAEVALATLADDARRSAQPCPALAHLGASIEGDVFVDLEAFGTVCVEGAPDLVRAIGASIALSPLAEPVQLVTVGLDEVAELSPEQATTCQHLDDAISLAAAHASHLAPLASNATTFRLRARRVATGSNEPMVVVVCCGADLSVEAAVALAGLTTPAGRGVAVVIDRPIHDAGATIRPMGDGVWRIDPLAIEFTALHLADTDLELIGGVLDAAAPDLDVAAEPAPEVPHDPAGGETASAAAAHSPIEWTFVVRLLGPVVVEHRDGGAVPFEKSKALELVAWLTQHRQHSGRGQARAALWDVDVRDATFANVVSDARRSLARMATADDGREWVGRAADHLPLHPGVVTDADLLTHAVAEMHAAPGPSTIAAVRDALALVRGIPFAETSYLWPDGEGMTSALILLVTSAAVELAGRCLVEGDIDGVFWATKQGLLVLPGHEELVALRMRAHGQRGDRAGVRQEWDSYERALRADTWFAGDPSPKLVVLRKELLTTGAVSR